MEKYSADYLEKLFTICYYYNMKKIQTAVFVLCAVTALFTSCVSSMVTDSLSTSLAGADKKGKPVQKKTSAHNPMLALTGETDVTLVGDFIPTALVMYEMLHQQNPDHLGLTAMTGSLNVMYANAFIQTPAELLGNEDFDKQHSEYQRAIMHYLRGRDYCLTALNGRHTGFKSAVLGTDPENADKAAAQLDKNDVNTAYWACAGWLAAFSLDPLNPDMLGNLHSPVAILEKAASLNPDYSDGAIWDILANFYISAPGEFGGDAERAKYCYEQALRASGGKTPGPYITYAESFCVSSGDEQGFTDALNKALSINPDDNPSSRLMTTISQKKARRLLDHKSDYFLHW